MDRSGSFWDLNISPQKNGLCRFYAKYKKKTNEPILRKMVSYKIDGRTDRPKFIGPSQKGGSNKLDHYGIRGISNKWLPSYLTERNQFVSIWL